MPTTYTAWARDAKGFVEFKTYNTNDEGYSKEGLEIWFSDMKTEKEVQEISKHRIWSTGKEEYTIIWKR